MSVYYSAFVNLYLVHLPQEYGGNNIERQQQDPGSVGESGVGERVPHDRSWHDEQQHTVGRLLEQVDQVDQRPVGDK